MHDWRRDDAPAVPQARHHLTRRHAVDLYIRNRAGLRRIEAGVDVRFRVAREALCPPVAEITKSSGFAFRADAFVKTERLGNRVVIGRRMRPDFLELADIVRL